MMANVDITNNAALAIRNLSKIKAKHGCEIANTMSMNKQTRLNDVK